MNTPILADNSIAMTASNSGTERLGDVDCLWASRLASKYGARYCLSLTHHTHSSPRPTGQVGDLGAQAYP